LRSAEGLSVRLQPQCTLAPPAIECRVLPLIIFFLVVWPICVQQAFAQNPQSDNQSNIVRGTVISAVTGQPIGRALVYAADNRYAIFTDSEGHFEFTLPRQELYSNGGSAYASPVTVIWLQARRPGFLESPNGNRPVEVSPGAEVTIPLMPEALIKGRVALPAADPARGINVELYYRQVQDGSLRWLPKSSARTNSDGEFRFAELEPGTYKVLTREWMDNDPEGTVPGSQRYGFPPVYFPSATDFAAASTIQLTGGQTFEADMSLVRQAYFPVKIPVTNPEQNGGMSVTVSPQGQRGPGYSLGYDRGKGAIVGQLPNGKYLVEGATFGPNSSAGGSVNLAVAGGPADGPAMVLARNISIPVNVKEEFTSQPSDEHVSWRNGDREFPIHGPRLDVNIRADAVDDFGSRRGGSTRQPTGPNDDSLVLENLAPGHYWLRITAHRGYVASASMGGADLLREPLVVVPGAATPIEITMRDDTAELEGTLLGIPAAAVGSGRFTPRVFVDCIPQPDSPGQFLELAVSSDGQFDLRSIAPGIYRVIAFSRQQEHIPYRDPEAMKAYESKGQVVHFAPGQKVTLQLQVGSGAD
jgi:hypothetical protein